MGKPDSDNNRRAASTRSRSIARAGVMPGASVWTLPRDRQPTDRRGGRERSGSDAVTFAARVLERAFEPSAPAG